MYRINQLKIVFILLILTLASCIERGDITKVLETPSVISRGNIYRALPKRIEDSKNAIAVTVEISHIDLSKENNTPSNSNKISLVTHFKNLSDFPVVFKKPITYGFAGPMGNPNDLDIVIEAVGDKPITVTPTSNYPDQKGVPTAPKPTIHDFVKLGPKDTYSVSMDIVLPLVYIEKTGYGGQLPKGIYKLRLIYTNYDVGYELPLSSTPPATFESLNARDKWYDDNLLFVDLDAWAGQITSDEAEFAL